MTVILPQDIKLFRQAFDETCNRILLSQENGAFYALLVQLTTSLRDHSILKDTIYQIENAFSKRQKEMCEAALDVLEYHWKKLWQYHRHSYRHRKKLANIKKIITSPNAISYSPLYSRIISSMWEF
jgi:hypothetical protein